MDNVWEKDEIWWPKFNRLPINTGVRDDIRFSRKYRDYSGPEVVVKMLPKPKRFTYGPWDITRKVMYMPVVVYENGVFKELVLRTARPREPFGPWVVYAIKYRDKVYSGLLHDIYGYMTLTFPEDDRSLLIKQARKVCKKRGHLMDDWTDLTPTKSVSKCTVCGRWAIVDAKPAPNSILVSGDALAMNCREDS